VPVEIDLLRGGKPMPMVGNRVQALDRILVSHSQRRPTAKLAGFGLQEPIPSFSLPLRHGNVEPLIDPQMLPGVYDRAGVDLMIDYSRQPAKAWAANDAT
jgi:hypothetical protein